MSIEQEPPPGPLKVPEPGTWMDTHLHQVAVMSTKTLTLIPEDVSALYPELPDPAYALDRLKYRALQGRLMQLGEAGYRDIAFAICKHAEKRVHEAWGVRYPDEDA